MQQANKLRGCEMSSHYEAIITIDTDSWRLYMCMCHYLNGSRVSFEGKMVISNSKYLLRLNHGASKWTKGKWEELMLWGHHHDWYRFLKSICVHVLSSEWIIEESISREEWSFLILITYWAQIMQQTNQGEGEMSSCCEHECGAVENGWKDALMWVSAWNHRWAVCICLNTVTWLGKLWDP